MLKIFEATTENLGQLILGVLILLAANTRSPVHESRLGEIFRTNLSAVLVLSVFLGLVSAAASSVKLVSSRRAVSIKGMVILVPYSLLCVATKVGIIFWKGRLTKRKRQSIESGWTFLFALRSNPFFLSTHRAL